MQPRGDVIRRARPTGNIRAIRRQIDEDFEKRPQERVDAAARGSAALLAVRCYGIDLRDPNCAASLVPFADRTADLDVLRIPHFGRVEFAFVTRATIVSDLKQDMFLPRAKRLETAKHPARIATWNVTLFKGDPYSLRDWSGFDQLPELAKQEGRTMRRKLLARGGKE